MKIGIEEEFLVIDPKTFFNTPAALRLANNIIYSNINYINKISVELPLNSQSIMNTFKFAKKAFCVIEIKTDPYSDIDELKNELILLRKELTDITEKNGYILIPSGLHPLFSSKNSSLDNCAALHIHIDGINKEIYKKILNKIPFLISISTNSPFYNGHIRAMSNRAEISSHIGYPKNYYDRESDLLINISLNTTEIRVLDTQITTKEAIALASILKLIAENKIFNNNISKEEYIKTRNYSIWNGRKALSISEEEYDIISSNDEYSKELLKGENGSSWQINIYKKYGLASVILSLWESFKNDKKIIKTEFREIKTDQIKAFNLIYFIPYAPFFFYEKIKKYHQDLYPLKKNDNKKEMVFKK